MSSFSLWGWNTELSFRAPFFFSRLLSVPLYYQVLCQALELSDLSNFILASL